MKNITLRPLETSDLDKLYLWENDRLLWNISGYTTPFSKEALAEFIDQSKKAESVYSSCQLRLMIEANGETIGCVDVFDFSPKDHRAGVGILIYDKVHRRLGYGQSAIKQLVEYIQTALSVDNIWAHVPISNLASRALFERCGFKISGTLRRWIVYDGKHSDVVVYQLIRE